VQLGGRGDYPGGACFAEAGYGGDFLLSSARASAATGPMPGMSVIVGFIVSRAPICYRLHDSVC
jgi:hypothetical protein